MGNKGDKNVLGKIGSHSLSGEGKPNLFSFCFCFVLFCFVLFFVFLPNNNGHFYLNIELNSCTNHTKPSEREKRISTFQEYRHLLLIIFFPKCLMSNWLTSIPHLMKKSNLHCQEYSRVRYLMWHFSIRFSSLIMTYADSSSVLYE